MDSYQIYADKRNGGKFLFMSDLPNNDQNQAKENTVYLEEDGSGKYISNHQGKIYKGNLLEGDHKYFYLLGRGLTDC